MSTADLLFTAISCLSNPTDVNTSVALTGATILKLPSAAVCVAALLPLTVTVTPEAGEPSFELVTLPVIEFCANAAAENNNNENDNSRTWKISLVLFLIKQAFGFLKICVRVWLYIKPHSLNVYNLHN